MTQSGITPAPAAATRLMFQGTASNCGKSLITTAFCRILHQEDVRVAPFKAQNMSNNSFVTADGLEMGRAQVVQARAAGIEPDVRMNPVLIKPSSDLGAQVVLNGRPSFIMDAKNWHDTRNLLRESIQKSWDSLAEEYEVILLEGAGSPAEINLKKNDIVNMGMAAMADTPVIVVGDIDYGGVFASLVGTMQLLDPGERVRVKGFIINKFRGEKELLDPGLARLEDLTGVPVLGVVPWIHHVIDDEDGVSGRFDMTSYEEGTIDICIIRLPHLSNFTDFHPLEALPGVTLRWCERREQLGSPDLLILPGTKATIADLGAIRTAGIADAMVEYVNDGGMVLGICGGFQMLGTRIEDPDRTESERGSIDGLGLLDMVSVFSSDKTTTQTEAVIDGMRSPVCRGLRDLTVRGYEIHHGRSVFGPRAFPFTASMSGTTGNMVNGITDATGRVLGTYLHGLFDSGTVTAQIVNSLREIKELTPIDDEVFDRAAVLESEFDHLAAIVRESVDMQMIMRLLNISPAASQ
jgi:adenosylcobyric acid synthase